MKPTFYDTHAHLDFPEFGNEVSDIVARAEAAGIRKIITIGTTLEKSRRAIQLADQFPNVYAAIGWHPSHIIEAPEEVSADLRALAQHPKIVAIGEAGLDYSRLPSAFQARTISPAGVISSTISRPALATTMLPDGLGRTWCTSLKQGSET